MSNASDEAADAATFPDGSGGTGGIGDSSEGSGVAGADMATGFACASPEAGSTPPVRARER